MVAVYQGKEQDQCKTMKVAQSEFQLLPDLYPMKELEDREQLLEAGDVLTSTTHGGRWWVILLPLELAEGDPENQRTKGKL